MQFGQSSLFRNEKLLTTFRSDSGSFQVSGLVDVDFDPETYGRSEYPSQMLGLTVPAEKVPLSVGVGTILLDSKNERVKVIEIRNDQSGLLRLILMTEKACYGYPEN